MVRERTPARPRQNSELGESWVVESDGDDECTPPAITSARQRNGMRESARLGRQEETPRKRIPRADARVNVEPELVMPSMHNGNIGDSWLGEEERQSLENGLDRTDRRAKKPQRSDGVKPHRSSEPATEDKLANLSDGVMSFVKPLFSYMYDVLGGALHAAKTPISYLIATWLLVGLLVLLRNLLFSSVYSAFSPLCRIPGTSWLNLPMCHAPVSVQYSGNEPPPVQFDELITVQNKFEDVLQESAGGVSLSLDMKRGETSIRVSTLPELLLSLLHP